MKKIVIFTCIGGHTSISQSLQDYLKDSYNVKVVNIFLDTLWPIDPIRLCTFGLYTSEDFYRFMLQQQLFRFFNVNYKVSYYYFNMLSPIMSFLIKRTMQQEKADAVISLIPFFNRHILIIAEQLNIPFLLSPTDMDIEIFLYKMAPITYNKFHLAITLDDSTIQNVIKPLSLNSSRVHITGAALKEGFFKTCDIEAIKKDLHIPHNRPVILLLMGSLGSNATLNFARKLATITTIPFHLIIVMGQHAKLYKDISAIPFGPNISTSLFAFTPLIPELMAISSLLITKAGGITMCEALYKNLPTFLDATGAVLAWEQINQQFMSKHKFSAIIHNLDELPSMVINFLSNKQIADAYKERMMQLPKKHGGENIKKVLQMCIK